MKMIRINKAGYKIFLIKFPFGVEVMNTVAMEQRKKIHPHKFTLWIGIGKYIDDVCRFNQCIHC